jgi:hypothetical protein
VKVKGYELRGSIFKSESLRNFIVNIILNSSEGHDDDDDDDDDLKANLITLLNEAFSLII